jgi:hypothetical protein
MIFKKYGRVALQAGLGLIVSCFYPDVTIGAILRRPAARGTL